MAYTNKSHYKAHLKTKLHERMSVINISNIENSTINIDNSNTTNNIQINLTPRELTNLNYDYLRLFDHTQMQ